jgi:hypothetical protein
MLTEDLQRRVLEALLLWTQIDDLGCGRLGLALQVLLTGCIPV